MGLRPVEMAIFIVASPLTMQATVHQCLQLIMQSDGVVLVQSCQLCMQTISWQQSTNLTSCCSWFSQDIASAGNCVSVCGKSFLTKNQDSGTFSFDLLRQKCYV